MGWSGLTPSLELFWSFGFTLLYSLHESVKLAQCCSSIQMCVHVLMRRCVLACISVGCLSDNQLGDTSQSVGCQCLNLLYLIVCRSCAVYLDLMLTVNL